MAAKKTKGEHGWLYLYRIVYRDPDPGCPDFAIAFWAYNKEHAHELFWNDVSDEDWQIVSVKRA